MAAPIRVGVLDDAEARDLVEALAVRGLIGVVGKTDDGCWVELNEPHEDTERLLAETTEAVEGWLLDRGRPRVDVQVGDETIAVEPGLELDQDLRLKLRQNARRPSAPR